MKHHLIIETKSTEAFELYKQLIKPLLKEISKRGDLELIDGGVSEHLSQIIELCTDEDDKPYNSLFKKIINIVEEIK